MRYVVTAAGRDAWRLLHEIFFTGSARDRLNAASAAIGVSPGVMKALFFLEPDESVRMGDLAEHLSCDASYVTNLADALEERGLAERRPHPTDRRVKTLVLTAGGIAAKQQLFDVIYEPPPEFDALSAAEQRDLRDLLRKVAATVQRDDEPLTHGKVR
jgi:MarR family transcriptional regulator, organic hydroperoxide resistance regulator